MPDNYVQALHGDARGRLWVGTTSAGLLRYEPATDRFVRYPVGGEGGLSHVSVRQVLDYVARGEVDAGFVYRTDALVKKDDTRIAFAVPTTSPVTYPIAQLAASKQAAAAQSFIAFVRGPEGQKILEGFGFSQP